MNRIVLSLDSHALSEYQTCPRKFQLSTIQRLRPRKKKAALSMGTLIHEMLAEYYNGIREGNSRDELSTRIAVKTITRADTSLDLEERTFIARRFGEYIQHYKEDWTPVLVEGFQHTGFSKVIYEDERVVFIYEGRIDQIVQVGERARNFRRWVDFKSQNPKYSYDRFENVNQFIGYSWASGLPGIIAYITWSKEPTEKTFRRQDVSFTPQFIEKWRSSTIEWYYRILKTLQSGDYDYNFSACDTKYGRCAFANICKSTNSRMEKWVINNEYERVDRWKAW